MWSVPTVDCDLATKRSEALTPATVQTDLENVTPDTQGQVLSDSSYVKCAE